MNSRITTLATATIIALGAMGAAMAQSESKVDARHPAELGAKAAEAVAQAAPPPPATTPRPQEMTPPPATPAHQVKPASALQPTTITSHEPDSTLANHVDFDAMDTNHDGMLSRREVSGNAELTRDFASIDANHDGQITRQELEGGK